MARGQSSSREPRLDRADLPEPLPDRDEPELRAELALLRSGPLERRAEESDWELDGRLLEEADDPVSRGVGRALEPADERVEGLGAVEVGRGARRLDSMTRCTGVSRELGRATSLVPLEERGELPALGVDRTVGRATGALARGAASRVRVVGSVAGGRETEGRAIRSRSGVLWRAVGRAAPPGLGRAPRVVGAGGDSRSGVGRAGRLGAVGRTSTRRSPEASGCSRRGFSAAVGSRRSVVAPTPGRATGERPPLSRTGADRPSLPRVAVGRLGVAEVVGTVPRSPPVAPQAPPDGVRSAAASVRPGRSSTRRAVPRRVGSGAIRTGFSSAARVVASIRGDRVARALTSGRLSGVRPAERSSRSQACWTSAPFRRRARTTGRESVASTPRSRLTIPLAARDAPLRVCRARRRSRKPS